MKRPLLILSLCLLFVSTANASTTGDILDGAYGEVENGTKYNTDMLETYVPPTYLNGLDTGKAVYPNGDVNPKEGVCADLVVRALRRAGIDLQEAVHVDVSANKKGYGVKVPDKYIDQRRVWILNTFFKRKWQTLTTELKSPKDWRPGDIVIWNTGSKRHLHIGIAGRKKRSDGFPYVIHNMRYIPFLYPGKTEEQDVLEGPGILGLPFRRWRIIGHYRLP